MLSIVNSHHGEKATVSLVWGHEAQGQTGYHPHNSGCGPVQLQPEWGPMRLRSNIKIGSVRREGWVWCAGKNIFPPTNPKRTWHYSDFHDLIYRVYSYFFVPIVLIKYLAKENSTSYTVFNCHNFFISFQSWTFPQSLYLMTMIRWKSADLLLCRLCLKFPPDGIHTRGLC